MTILWFSVSRRYLSTAPLKLKINEKTFESDGYSNVRPKILEHINKNLHLKDGHPLSFVGKRIVNYFYENFKGKTGNSIFSVYDRLDPVVSTVQNFDSLLVPENHPSRCKSDCYYINKNTMLRSHMTAHQCELIKMGLNNFLMVGDVYRRDEVDTTHYPVFHQLDGVSLFSAQELFMDADDGKTKMTVKKEILNDQKRTDDCQEIYSKCATERVQMKLKCTLEELAKCLFGNDIAYKWTTSYFPFTHPSWELEIEMDNKWIEVLGCGVIEYEILKRAGCENRIGWAFGVGLERLAMILYNIPDIRLFWSKDSGFLNQFASKTFSDKISYQPISKFPQCRNDISFWLPESYSTNDFHDLVREIGGDYVEQLLLVDEYKNPKTGRISHCYSVIYRHMEKTLTQSEVNKIHKEIEHAAELKLKVQIR